jgi:two-component system nitrogen regulation response regulator NtrX
MAVRVLIVEDDVGSQVILRGILSKIDPFLRVTCVASAESGYRALNEACADELPFDVVIADLDLPGSNGLVLLDASKKVQPELEFLFISGSLY